jgi:hypothetical protein
MAGLIVSFTTAEVALAAATAKTVLRVKAATNQRARLKRWGVFFDGTSVTAEPVQVRLLRQTTDGTGTANTGRVVSPGGAAEAVQTAAIDSCTAEPTAGDVLDAVEVHPQAGYEVIFPMDQEVDIPGGGRVGIECTAPAGVNVRSKMVIEE